MLARPVRHALDGGVADDEVDHDDDRPELMGELGPLVHLLHRAGGDVEVVALHLAGVGLGAVHRLHREEETVAPVHEGLRVDVLVVLHEVEAAPQGLVHDATVVLAREPELRLHRGAQQRPPELVEPLPLHHDAGGRPLERLHVGHRQPHVLQAQRLHRLEAEDVADDRGGEVGDGALLEERQVVGDAREPLLRLGRARPGAGHRVHLVGLGAIAVAGREPVGPHHRPGGGGGLARHGRGRLLRLDALLRRDAEEGDDVGVLGHVVGLPVAHRAVGDDAGGVAVALGGRSRLVRCGAAEVEVGRGHGAEVREALP